MKILYVGTERSDAHAVATALRGIQGNVAVSWASRLDRVAKWVDENRDLAALIVEAHIDGGNWPSVVKLLRGRAVRPAIVVITPDGIGAQFESLASGADDCIARNDALYRELPLVITRAVARARREQPAPKTTQPVTENRQPSLEAKLADAMAVRLGLERARADLEQKLAQATAALQDAESRHQEAVAASAAQMAERQAQYEIGMARAEANWGMVDEQLRDAAREVERARQLHAAAAADVDRLSRREAELSSQLAKAAATTSALELRLADADTGVQAANGRAEQGRLAAAQLLAERERELQSQIAQALDARRDVEEALSLAERDLDSKAVDVDRLTTREADLTSMLANAEMAQSDLERRLAATVAAFEDADTRSTRERLAASRKAAEREAELDGQIQQERTTRATLEQAVADAGAALRDAEQQHAAALETANRDLAERTAQFDRELSQIAADRDSLTQQLSDVGIALDHARRDHRSATDNIERLTQREAELSSTLAEVQAERAALDQAVADANAALRDAKQQHNTALREAHQQHDEALTAAANDLANRQAQFERELAQVTAERNGIQQQLSESESALDHARRDHRSSAADVERLTQREAELSSRLAEVSAARTALEQAVADADAARRDATQQHDTALRDAHQQHDTAMREAHQRHDAALAAAASDLAARQAQFDRELSHIAADRDGIRQQLSETEISLDQVRRDHQSASADVDRLTQREAELTSQLADVHAVRTTLERAVEDAAAALRDATQQHDTTLRETHRQHDAAMAAAANELAERQAQFDRELSHIAAERDGIRQQLSESEIALDQTRRDHQSAADAVERLTQREAELTSQLAEVHAARTTLAQAVEDAAAALRDTTQQHDTALRDAHQQHDAAMAVAASEFAERQAQFDRELSQVTADRDGIRQQLSESAVALDQVRHDHRSASADVERLTQRETELTAQLAEVHAVRATLEQAVEDAAAALGDATQQHDTALRDAQQQHDTALAAAANELAERQAQFDRDLSQVTADRDGIRQQLSETETALDQARRDHQSASADVERLTQREAELTSLLAEVQAARQTLDIQLTDANERAVHERAAAADREADLEARLAQEIDTRGSVERTLIDARSAALDERTQSGVRFAQERLEHETRLADAEDGHRRLLFERDAEIQRLTAERSETARILEEARSTFQEALTAAAHELEMTKRRKEELQAEADQLPQLQTRLEESRAESHRLFQQAGSAMLRCTREGTLTEANRAFATLVGRRTIDELRGMHFATTVFEAPKALFWLIERCLATRTKESIETTWRRQDGSRLFVRLSASFTASGVIEIAAEDLTRIRVLQERLGQAHRMEAVGRLASEVSATCGNMLNNIRQHGQEWLTAAGGTATARRHGDMLLDEATRAAGILKQLAECGEEQARTPMLVDLNTLIRDLEPVLKRVAGDDVVVQLRDTSSPLNVDVGTERVERLLVNLASYGRERMPSGGRLKIELDTIVVNRHFAAKHPNVRLGPHALITVTETRRTTGADGAARLSTGSPQSSQASIAQKPGVDFGTLQELVTECGGHLWMTVQPRGDMVAKVRLPLMNSLDITPSVTTRAGRERTLTGWFQH